MRRNRRLTVQRLGRIVAIAVLAALPLALFSARSFAQEEKEPSVQEIIATMKKAILDKNDPMRNRMFFKLRKIGKPAVAPLVEVLSDSESAVSAYAAFTLGWIAEPEGVEPVVAYLRRGNTVEKKAALQALGNMAWGTDEKVRKVVHEKAVPLMIELLGKGDIVVRREAAYGLGLAGDKRALAPLGNYVEDADTLLAFQAKGAIERIEQFGN
jgi:HEAT repeat protein